MKFKRNDIVRYVKSGKEYVIYHPPMRKVKLEYCNEECYQYGNSEEGVIWFRRKSEMEDGRFELVGSLNSNIPYKFQIVFSDRDSFNRAIEGGNTFAIGEDHVGMILTYVDEYSRSKFVRHLLINKIENFTTGEGE